MHGKKRLTVGISGASGASLAVSLLRQMALHDDWETHVVVSGGGARILEHELGMNQVGLLEMATEVHPLSDVGATIASGTFKTEGMVIIPCSMKTLSGVCHGYSDNLLLRAADVTLKERRKLVLVARETPLSLIHLRNMTTLTEMGAVVLPPVMTFYNHPQDIDDMRVHIVGKVLGEFGVEANGFRRWDSAQAAESGHRGRVL